MAMAFAYDDGYDYQPKQNGVRKVVCSWTSDGSGNASGTTSKIAGTLVKAVTVPSDGPTDNYDIQITDDLGVDVLAACQSTLANRHTSTTQQVYFLVLDAAGTPLAQSLHPVVCGPLTIAVTNAGAAKSGTLSLYFKS